MKNKFLKTLQRYSVAALLLLLVNCQQDDVKPDTENVSSTQNSKSTYTTVTASDIPDVMNFLNAKTKGTLEFSLDDSNNPDGNYRTHEDDLVITTPLLDAIQQVTNEYGVSNYTFELIKDRDSQGIYFLNLVVKEFFDGYEIIIIKYVPDENWIIGKSLIKSLIVFTGDVYYYTIEGSYLGKFIMDNGESIGFVRHPCEDENPTGGGYGGGTGTEGGNEGTGVGGTDNGTGTGTGTGGGSAGCFYQITWYSCGGSEGNIAHSADVCRGPLGGGAGALVNWECPGVRSMRDLLRHPCDEETNNSECASTIDCEYGWGDDCNCLEEGAGSNPEIAILYGKAAIMELNKCLSENLSLAQGDALINSGLLTEASSYVQANGGENCSSETAQFLEAVIETVESNGDDGVDVDFEKKRINGIKLDSTVPPCLQGKILDLMLGNFPYSDTALNIDLIQEVFEALGTGSPEGIDFVTTFSVAQINGNGETSGLSWDAEKNRWNCTITINQDLVNDGTKLALIKTVLHESIHAYLKYLRKGYPAYFGTSNEFTQLILNYKSYKNVNDPHHIYMGDMIEDIATNVGNFVSERYGYPSPASSGTALNYYEAVSWSGLTHLQDGITLNPVFTDNYPGFNDQQDIIKKFNTENGTATYPGYIPLLDNNCN